ncbi:MAG TPA: PhzF family phenazine biosynthesis isomerase [Solirubrobacteraceae bacterium]
MTARPRRIPIACVDAFADEAFRGNPAAVCLLDRPLDDAFMQSVAAELNLSETAFVVTRDDVFDLRWFTPTTEVELCGHATLASAHVLYETERLARDRPARFRTRWRGELVATSADDGIALDFPAAPARAVDAPPGLAAALGAEPIAIGLNDLHHVVELADAATVRALTPDIAALASLSGVEGLAVTAAGDEPGVDFVSRYFAPKYGIDEDPVTGSAHTSLGPWWAERLGRTHVVGRQVSARGGTVRVEVDAPAPGRVTLAGRAVTVWHGELLA